MPWREQLLPERMTRTAIVAPETGLRRVLVEVADIGVFEPDPLDGTFEHPLTELAKQATADSDATTPELSVSPVDTDELARTGQVALLVGEASLEQRLATTRRVGRCAVLPGWIPSSHVDSMRRRLAQFGGAVAELPLRRGLLAPTAHARGSMGDALRPLVTTYATVPYRDVDPTLFAAAAYMVMFGMMFGDVAHGLAVVLLGLLAYRFGTGRLPAARRAAPFLIGAGAAATGFGLLYGEAFGPTGLVPTLWFRPLDEPETLLVVGLLIGACLLAATFVLATVNRWREAGPAVALYDASGIGGALLFAGTAAVVGGAVGSISWLSLTGIAVAVAGAVLTFIGLFVSAGPGPAGFAQALVEMFDTVLRLGSNIVSFTRLAAFGLTHAVLTEVTWDGTVSLWDRSGLLPRVAASALFVVGNLAAFALGALVGAIQALRLEYYEMFSRLFATQGRPFEPWHISTHTSEIP
jgi:V/A-type H+-transporting ATPase subunit I